MRIAGLRVRGQERPRHGLIEAHQARIARAAEEYGLVLQEPASRLVDADEKGLVALEVQRLENESRREQRDLVLRGAPAEQHRDPELPGPVAQAVSVSSSFTSSMPRRCANSKIR